MSVFIPPYYSLWWKNWVEEKGYEEPPKKLSEAEINDQRNRQIFPWAYTH